MTVVTRYPAGQSTHKTRPGDFILTHRNRPYSWLVSHGQRLRFTGDLRPFSHWSHVALISDENGGLIEALSSGVKVNTLDEYKHVEYHYVSVGMDDHDRAQAVAFAQSCLGQEYGWAEICGLAFCLLTGSRLQFGFNGTEICSGLVARSLERGPFIFPKSPNTMMPADLALYFDITP